MYDYIKGTVTTITPEYIVVEAGQIGYQIITGNPFSFQRLEGTNAQVFLYQHVREDNISLFGFQTTEERYLFKKLLSVSGIGPKSALAIIASGDVVPLITAIESEDDVYLTKFPSVGKKTARQIILDLKGKLADVVASEIVFTAPGNDIVAGLSPQLEEAVLALEALGYSTRELKKVIPKLAKETDLTSDAYIKLALQLMTK
ncbi:Holliday junction branch migration protein RuvA [Listeria cossartiae subsp. cayugensis]|uniref:Holliday junction branch migration complex subunit RuvA n=1 Tax=Listeria cossartiae subsp. cayugensis TaxID=2713505 RepID=A0ABU2IJA2_9LIST|nr:Holliday junction branch migration protein RuvA [Listeria cossartiae]MDT0048252.1 Holliday junction branch migration protein RuvA [Listeria cossartiae subsp. cayugensis]MDT0064755.1 Holliday junction branch migration protein RuvA [Listeria cossartiae subsp. cayugensis]MDT0079641.1 Holliday junction branch migration protein RuvA [Listeria cossartiae subsp. cayugensis]MDT0082477.1 Holliday junction branch migration protein RuvA [Listeria cossartiae subsp. cayugensis]MDT0086988.1 Holliday junc